MTIVEMGFDLQTWQLRKIAGDLQERERERREKI